MPTRNITAVDRMLGGLASAFETAPQTEMRQTWERIAPLSILVAAA